MAFWVYMLLCSDGKYYTGHTDNLDRRIAEHQSGLISGFTASRLPVKLVWSESFSTRLEALECELRVKNWSKAKKRALANGDWQALKYFAKPPSERPINPFVSSEVETPEPIEPKEPVETRGSST